MSHSLEHRRADAHPQRPRFSDVLRSEYLKLLSLPVSVGALLGLFVVGAGGALFLGVTLESSGPPSVFLPALTVSDVVTPLVVVGQIIAGILGVMVVGAEYATGTITTTLVVVPDRLRVLRAKAVVAFTVAAGTGAVTVVTAWAVTTPFYAPFGLAVSLAQPGVALSFLSVAGYLGCCALLGVGVATIVRSTTAGTIIVFLVTLLLPVMISLLPYSLVSRVLRIIQFGNAGDAMTRLTADGAPFLDLWSGQLSVGAGWIIALVWATIALWVGAMLLRVRDV